MTKHLLTAALLGSIALGAAAESSIVYTYANDEVDMWGKAKAEKIDVAMCINNPALAGKKITSVSALVNKDDGIQVVSLWLSKELAIDSKKQNVADICSMTAPEISPVEIAENWTAAKIEASLPEPYVITTEPVYVGYSIDVTANATNEEKYPIILSNASNPDGLFLHMSKSVLKWKNYTSTIDAVAAIYVTIEGDFHPCSLGIKEIPLAYAEKDKPYEVMASVMNVGSEAVNSIDYSYTIDGKTSTGHVDLETPLATDITNPYQVALQLEALDAIGTYDAVLTIDKVNGKENVSGSSEAKFQVCVMPFVPVHRPLVEEATGLWCGWCTRGYLAMELINEFYGDNAVAVAYHDGDQMSVTGNPPVAGSGYPRSSINRGSQMDPYYGTHNNIDFGISKDVEDCINEMVDVDLFLTAGWEDDSKTQLNVQTDVRFIRDMNVHYRVGYTLCVDGLEDPSWGQGNYYAGQNYGGYLAELCTWPSTVYGLVFNDVAIDVKAARGVPSTIPHHVVMGESYVSMYSFNVGDTFTGVYGDRIPIDKDKLYIAAYIINKDTGKVINANKIRTEGLGLLGVEGVSSDVDESDAPVEYYNLNGVKVANPDHGIFIRRQGSKTTKVAL